MRRALQSLAALGAGLMITPSRRTPAAVTAYVQDATEGRPRVFWDGDGDNPYPHFLAHADAFIAPANSVNMTGEPCATGKPVYVFEPEGGSRKFARFHDALRRHGATRPLPARFERLETWSYPPHPFGGEPSPPRSPGAGSSGGRCWEECDGGATDWNLSLSSRALCPGSIYQPAPAFVDGWIPATSAGMTSTVCGSTVRLHSEPR